MEWSIWAIILAVILFIVGLKIAKWVLWSLAIIIAVVAGWIWIF